MADWKRIRTYSDFENSVWASEIYPEFKMGIGAYRIYIDVQNIYSISLQLASNEQIETAAITAIRIVPVAEQLFDLGRAYMGNLICDYIYGDGAFKDDAQIKAFGKQIELQQMEFDVPKLGVFRVKLFGIDIKMMGLHCDGPEAYEWIVPRREEFLTEDIQ